ncbi:hypothetical protein ACE6H2_018877 [Prunus campanulata]
MWSHVVCARDSQPCYIGGKICICHVSVFLKRIIEANKQGSSLYGAVTTKKSNHVEIQICKLP